MAKITLRGYSADTQILTRRGWATFDQISGADQVATRSASGFFEWQQPANVIWRRYQGDMVQMRSRTTDVLVTPDHPVLYYERHRKVIDGKRTELPLREAVTLARALIGEPTRLIATSQWNPPPGPATVFLESRPVRDDGRRNVGKPPLPFAATADDFCAFLGMYLSEGNLGPDRGTGSYPVMIWQTPKGKGIFAYQDLLDRIFGRHVPWRSSNGSWCICNKALFEYLKPLGGHAWTKRIPGTILDLDPERLSTFWHYFWLGDGSVMSSSGRKDIEVIQTTSRSMIDSFQEILQKLGTWSPIHVVHRKPESHPHWHTLYRVVRRASPVAFATHISRVTYSEMIGCVAVPNPAIYVRRGDRPVWSGSLNLT
jgi:hypothetical protein